jgi:hypothetical protein
MARALALGLQAIGAFGLAMVSGLAKLAVALTVGRWRRWRSARRFARELRRAGVPEMLVRELVGRYRQPLNLSWRQWLRDVRKR